MRGLIAYILLFFYTVTCSGATVYMHFCHGTPVLSIQEQESIAAHKQCPMCAEHPGHATESHENHNCDTTGQHDCCKDVKIELKKLKAENSATALSFLNFSPAITSVYWVSLFQQFIGTHSPGNKPELPKLLAWHHPPTYLIHCNFRI